MDHPVFSCKISRLQDPHAEKMNKTQTNTTGTNTTSSPYDFTQFNLIVSGLSITQGSGILFFNAVVIVVYMKSKEKVRRKVANILLCNQAFVDLFQGKEDSYPSSYPFLM